jgi:flagellar basal body-associated protein FliL
MEQTSKHIGRLAVVGVVVLLVAAILSTSISYAWGGSTKRQPPSPTPEEIAKSHARKAQQECERSIDTHLEKLDEFFADCKNNTPAFAKTALGWRSKWNFVRDYVPFSSGNNHRQFLEKKFAEQVFTPQQLEDALDQVVKDYIETVGRIERQMLRDLRAEAARLPAANPISRLSEQQLQQLYDQLLAEVVRASGNQAINDAVREGIEKLADSEIDKIRKCIGRKLVEAVAFRFGRKAGMLGAGAAAAPWSMGSSLAASLVLDELVEYVFSWIADPRKQLANEINQKLDEMRDILTDGSSESPGLRDQLREFARERATLREQAVIKLLQSTPPAKR